VKMGLALVVGTGLTTLGVLLTTMMDAEWVRWIFLLPWALLGTLLPHPNIGTPEHPIYEGTPLDLFATVIGLPMSALMNMVIAYFVMCRFRRSRDRRS